MESIRNQLSVSSEMQGASPVIRAVGVVTLDTSFALAGALRRAVSSGASAVTVGLRRVGLMDGSGLALLVEASRRLRSPVTPCAPRALVTAGGQPERILERGRFSAIIEIITDTIDLLRKSGQ